MEALVTASELCIRPFVDGDIEAFVAAVRESAGSVGAWMPWCHVRYAAAEASAWFEHCTANLRAGQAYDVGIFAAADGGLLGGVSINQLNRAHNFGNVGYWVRASRQRRGVATRAVRLMSGYGFGVLGLTRLEIVAAVGNVPSRAVALKAGAELECIARNRLLVHGQPVAAAVYSLIPAGGGS